MNIAFGDWGDMKEDEEKLIADNFTTKYLAKYHALYDAILFLGDIIYNLDLPFKFHRRKRLRDDDESDLPLEGHYANKFFEDILPFSPYIALM